MSNAQIDRGTFAHPALLYRTPQEYLDCLLPLILEGLDAEEPVLVAVPGPNLAVLGDGLGASAAHVVMVDMTEAGRNPGRILGEVLSPFVDKHRDQPVRMIGEPVWPSRTEVEYPACVQHEALIHRAFTGCDVTVVCPYDVAHLDPGVIADARSTHPVLWQAGSPKRDSPAYALDAAWARYNQPLSRHPAAVRYTARKFADLAGARAFVGAYAQWFGLSPERTADLQLIASELTTSSLTHTGRACRLALWQDDGHLVCEARDCGCLDDPLVGHRPYGSESARGRGLYVVNVLADLVRTHTTAGETTIQAYLRPARGALMRPHAVLDSAAGLTPFGHVAWGFRDRAEFYSQAAEYIGDGLRHNQYIAYVGEGTREALRAELAEMPGIGERLDSGDLEATPAADYYVYLPGTDVIDADAVVAKYLAGVEQAITKGYTGFRAVSDVTPVARTAEQRDALARLEYLVDQQMAVLPFSALCACDLSELGAAAAELMCLHPFVSKGSVTFRLYADPAAEVAFALTGEIDASTDDLFETTLQRVWPLASGHTLRINAQNLTFISHQQLFKLEERAREQDRRVELWTDQPVVNRLVEVLGLTRVRAQLR